MDNLFYSLPKALQDKILPPRQLPLVERVQEKVRFAKMESTIVPKKFRTRAAALASEATNGARGAVVPPCTNRGGKSSLQRDTLPSWESKEKLKIYAVGQGAKFQMVAIPRPDKTKDVRHSFIDWVTFTFKTVSFPMLLPSGHLAITNTDYVTGLSAHLFSIFGYGISEQRQSGLNGYKESYDIGENGWGVVCVGGQNDSLMVTIKGQGLMSSQPGWESRLLSFLRTIPTAKITRVDLACDDYDSKVSVDDYLEMYKAGLFVNRGRAPNVEQAGNWVTPNGKGRTLYVGSRTSGKLLRVYEKGLQLANGFHEKYPNWLRVELELANKDRIIPLDVLLRPGQYLAGAYPALANLNKVQERVETFKKTAESTVERTLEITRHQFGRHIWALVEYFGIDEAIQKITEGKEQLPKALSQVLSFQVERDSSEYIHGQRILTYDGVIPV